MDAISPSPTAAASLERDGEEAVVRLSGDWTMVQARPAEAAVSQLALSGLQSVTIDLKGVGDLDMAGAWLIHRLRARLEFAGCRVIIGDITERHRFLFSEIEGHVPDPYVPPARPWRVLVWLEGLGRTGYVIWRDTISVLSMLGAFAFGLGSSVLRPGRLRGVSILANFQRTCMGAVPIVVLMSFLIGVIIAQQGGFYLRQFGADVYAIDLVGVLVLREIGGLLTAIMVAGRSGSAFTAEIGSMRMREEVDALKVIGIDPIEALVLPRLVALIFALPVLTFLADLAALVGAGLVMWLYLGITPENYTARLHEAVTVSELYIGLVKAPAMALIIGLIACMEGLKVEGSAESLGRQTTTSVVKAIFMVIVLDGLFAVFFAAIGI